MTGFAGRLGRRDRPGRFVAVTAHPDPTAKRPVHRATPFRALRQRNYRLFFVGQVLSVIGTWTHTTAVAWIVLRDTGSSTDLGVLVAAQYLPLLLLGTWAGALADRLDKRLLISVANGAAAIIALATAIVVGAGHRSVAVLLVMSMLLGVASAFETASRQSFAAELVEPHDIPSAVGLNAAIMTGSRMVGSALAGGLIVAFGATVCLYLNAVSFLAVIGALLMMRTSELRRRTPVIRSRGLIRDGIRYARSEPEVRFPLAAMAIVGTLALNTAVTTPLLARITFGAGPGLFAAFGAVGGLGAMCGSLYAAGRSEATRARIGRSALAFGVLTLATACSPWAWLAMPVLASSACAAAVYVSSTNARLQQVTADAYRGRVMSLYAVLFLGSTPVGSLIIGGLSELTSPRVGVSLGGLAAVATGAVAVTGTRRHSTRRASAPAGSLP